jgi:3-oxoacyl-[acyl-carrier protein] reductase
VIVAYTYLVTGATSDLGLALIERLLARGGGHVVAAQGNSGLPRLAPLAKKYPGRLRTFGADLAGEATLPLFLEAVEQSVGAPTHFVHLPALRVVSVKFKHFDEARFHQDMRIQVDSAVAVCKRFVPAMVKAGFGRVVFMLTSYLLGTPPRNTAAYVMAKQALHGLAQSLAADYAAAGVTVNCVAPAMAETRFLADTSHLVVAAAAEAHPMGRLASPADVVPAIDFLLGDEAGYITGVVLPITGGA